MVGAVRSILNLPEHVPLLEVATRNAFVVLAENLGGEIALASVVMVPPGFRANEAPRPRGFPNDPAARIRDRNDEFLIEDDGLGTCIVTTQTRVRATDPFAKRKFAAYWRVIYPGSAVIRRVWLRAIKKRTAGSGS